MTKIGIIRCQELAIGPGQRRCAGWNCFPAVLREKVGLPVKEKTHTSPRGDFKPGQVTEYGVVGGGATAPAAAKKPRAAAHRGKKTAAK